MSYFIDNLTVFQIFYHVSDFGIALPVNLDLDYTKSLSIMDCLEYFSDSDIPP
jgi:hypothetical protein